MRSSTLLLAALSASLLLADGSPGPLANSCGVPANPPSPGRGRGTPTFPAGQYPVQLPAVSMLGAHNDLPNPYRDGVDWGNLPEGRHWGSTASIFAATDGNIWVVDRCGISGAGGTTCAGPNAAVDPVFEFDTSGKLIKSFGAVAGASVDPSQKATILASGISEAMNCTAFGLGVAIVGLIGFAVLNSKTQQIEDDINEASVQILNLVVANRQKVNIGAVQAA